MKKPEKVKKASGKTEADHGNDTDVIIIDIGLFALGFFTYSYCSFRRVSPGSQWRILVSGIDAFPGKSSRQP